nr:nickel-dependent hydrogenase large subunit [Azospirillum oleiclasticum]
MPDGNGLAAHAAARLAEIAALPGRLRALLPDLTDDAGRAAPDAVDGSGAGVVETARGRLAHRVRLERGRVADFRSVAPTEWNFHPDGALARGLTGAEAGPGLEERVRLLVMALDPCVPWTLEIGTLAIGTPGAVGVHHA